MSEHRKTLINRLYGAERFFAMMGMTWYAELMIELRKELTR